MSERQTDTTAAGECLRGAQHAPVQSESAPAAAAERPYEHVIDALCSAAGRILDVSVAADGEPTVPEYP
jgi:hypothetical protein